MSRAENRHYQEREKAHVRRFVRQRFGDARQLADDPRWVGKYIHSYPCSCHRCGNPRRHFGKPTMQERRQSSSPP